MVSRHPPVLADSHCHLQLLQKSADAAVANAAEQGVQHLLCVAVELPDRDRILPFCDRFPGVSASAGLHPNHIVDVEPDADTLAALADHRHVVAIGETGLDYCRTGVRATLQQQRLRCHVRAARTCNKPLIIHCRDAWDETLRLLHDEKANDVGGVMHCFTGNLYHAERAMDMGFMISFSGIVTFRNANELRRVAQQVPQQSILLETDCPYLTPVPHRGKENEPAMLRHTAQCLAELRQVDYAVLAAQTTANYRRLFATAA